ncbi:Uncharacterised protein [Halioglobus japonicus]|nr:Uncharacterised protein [Halioglobus japonicus]
MSDDNFTENKSKMPSHIAYSVEEGKGEKNHWQKIGAAWPAKNDGLTLKLNAVPLDGVVTLRSREELERLRAERQQSQGAAPKKHLNQEV